MSAFTIECIDKVQIPGHGWLMEGYVQEGVVFPGSDFALISPAGERILIGTIMAFIQGDDLADYVMEGQNCGVLLRYLDLTDVDLEGCTMKELHLG